MTDTIMADTTYTPSMPSADSSAAVSTTMNSPEKPHTPKKHPWLFDAAVYAGVVNTSVFLLSVFITYKTNYGEKGSWIRKRGDISKEWTQKKFQNWFKMPADAAKESANNAMMVFWSFADGSLLAPVAAWLESKRPNEPEKEEKAQRSFKSLILGRAATALIVVPTAITLDKTGWNEKLLNAPGQKLGNWFSNLSVTKKMFPELAKKIVINNDNKPVKFFGALGNIGTFEIFYTSVCTLGLWLSSKWIANLFHRKHHQNDAAALPAASTQDSVAAPEPEQAASSFWTDKTKTVSSPRIAPTEGFVSRAQEASASPAAPAM